MTHASPAQRRIHTYRDPVIREKAAPLSVFTGANLASLISDMTAMMHALNGIGIAANQAGEAKRIFIYASQDGDIPLLNPRIVKRSLRSETGEEGCLSVPGVFGLVKRYREVEMEATAPGGKPVRFRAKGLLARVMQHELDHLDGTLFIDRAKGFTTTNADAILPYRQSPVRR